ncbi:ABC transporter ATP-binding protein [Tsukamurella pseudospumae]|uniref:ABC transporter domain-containing protein n=1 Tax=Tsukamurella pseudospumae TaxID=239498 RepID=A0A137YZL8_9ACTN|nr:ABC transporter ATP-binding protein [Tsukamurella pseudospumae]KXO91323.1 hypothetical protein AXK61_07145 [Tsukamurella pseudospumae]
MTGAIDVEDVDVAYRRRGAAAVSGASLTVRRGELVGVIGPNGSGKSTLLKALVGIASLRSGRIVVDGVDAATMRGVQRAALLGYVPQQDLVHGPALTVVESIALGVPAGVGRADGQERAVGVAHRLGLGGRVLRRTDELSGGQRQRVTIGRALVRSAPYLLLDEPVSSLDLRYQGEIMGLLRELADDGTGVLVVLHDLNLAAAYCDRLVVVSDGRIGPSGPARDVVTEELVSGLYGDASVVREVDGVRYVLPSARRGVRT